MKNVSCSEGLLMQIQNQGWNPCEDQFRWEDQFGPLLFFLCSDFILIFDFVSSFGRTDAQYTLFWVLYS
jgi:hypothetical protein